MSKFQTIVQMMAILNEDGHLKPESQVYKMVREMVSDKIDRLGSEKALAQIKKEKAHYLDQIRILSNWHKYTGGKYPIDF